MKKESFLIFIIVIIIIFIVFIGGCIDDKSTGNSAIIKGKDGIYFTIMVATCMRLLSQLSKSTNQNARPEGYILEGTSF